MIKVTRDRKNWISQDRCVLGISLHNPSFSGNNFLHMINWINEQNQFRECRISLADELNRHNYMMTDGLSLKEATIKARRHGDLWLDRHQIILNRLRMPFHIIRWETWLTNIHFQEVFTELKVAFQENLEFSKAVKFDAIKYFKRKGFNEDQILPKEMLYSITYILEELAVYSIFFNSYNAVKIYPAREMESFKILRYGKVPNVSKGLMNYHHGRITFQPDNKKALFEDIDFYKKNQTTRQAQAA